MHNLTTKLLAWYQLHRRELPWRKTRNPYHIFISELMLQQTQVERVVPKYREFLKTFPTWKSLATATTPDLIQAWAGLGYNRRVLYAREAARQVVAHGIPTDEPTWRSLKGVGPYMAAALTEFASHKRALVLDTNIRRIVGRTMLGIPFPYLTDDPRILSALDTLTPTRGAHADIPQAMMDFANAICLPTNPTCATCPLRAQCNASQQFLSDKKPIKPKRRATERVHRDKPFPDRIYRGRILALVRAKKKITLSQIGNHIDPAFDSTADSDWLAAMASRLAKDGLIVIHRGDTLSLPNS